MKPTVQSLKSIVEEYKPSKVVFYEDGTLAAIEFAIEFREGKPAHAQEIIEKPVASTPQPQKVLPENLPDHPTAELYDMAFEEGKKYVLDSLDEEQKKAFAQTETHNLRTWSS